jgi:putative transposase
MTLSHKIRMNPTKTQEAYFMRACGTSRFTYNWALAEWKRLYGLGEKPSGNSLKIAFNAIRKTEFPWTYDVHRDCTSQPFANIHTSFSSFFNQQTRYPKFKKKGAHDSFYVANDRIKLDGKAVRLPVLGRVKLRESLRFEGKILAATVSRTANRWFLSIQVDVGDYKRVRTGDTIVGVDLGIKALATLSTGEVISGPKALRCALKRLARCSRRHSRKVKGSSNRKKSQIKLSRLHCRIADIRGNALHVLTTRLCRENQAVGIEDLNVRGMLRNHHLALSISDAGFGEFRRLMEYKKNIWDTTLDVHDRWFPSSKTCSACGFVLDALSLKTREWTCPQCGSLHDRDVNAATNLIPCHVPAAAGNGLGLRIETTPVEIGALTKTRKRTRETPVDEAGTCVGGLFCLSTRKQD